MNSLASRAAGQLPLVRTIQLTDDARVQLHTDARNLQQLLCTTPIRKQHGHEECQVMLFALDLCLNSITPAQADADLVELVERITRILK